AMATAFELALIFGPFVPLALVAGWRTSVHARRYVRPENRGWQGVAESAAVGFVIALAVLARGIVMRPLDAPPYLIADGGGALRLGLAIGLVLRAAAMCVLAVLSPAID